jgi:lipoate-protein ligase A
MQGHTDLAIDGLKFSGNSQRRRKNALLFHGSFLCNFDLALIEKALPMPTKQPDYRLGRSHKDFLINLKAPADMIKAALTKVWNATEPLIGIPFDRIEFLIQEKYGLYEWNLKF